MNNWKKAAKVILIATTMAGMITSLSYGASRKKITSVNVNIESKVELGTKYGDEEIEVDVRGKHYTYDYYELENFGFEWEEADVREITIYLLAEEGYYFALTRAASVKLTGATYVKATKQDSSETLALRVKLPSMEEMVGEETDVVLSEDGYARWGEVRGAGSYELRLYRNGIGVGATYQNTNELFYDFTSAMKKPGAYYVKVRGVNKRNVKNKGDWAESPVLNVSNEMAEAIQNGTAVAPSERGQWMNEGEQWWYQHPDGSYTQNNWEQIENNWYFFDEFGYRKTGWIEWEGEKYYCSEETGEMLRDTTTPDGFILDSEGHPKNS